MRSEEWPHPRSPLPEQGEGDFCVVWVYPGTGTSALSPGLYIKAAPQPIAGCRIKNGEG